MPFASLGCVADQERVEMGRRTGPGF
jgi:hypothetical protein